MKIVTQDNVLLNFDFIRTVSLYDGVDESGREKVVIISAETDRIDEETGESEDIDLAVYTQAETADKQFLALQTAIERRESLFRFPKDEDEISYHNRFTS